MCIWQIHSQPLTASSCLGNSALSVHVLLFPRWQYGLCANLTCGLLPRRKLTFTLHKTILNVNFYTDMFYVSRGVMRWPASAAEQNSLNHGQWYTRLEICSFEDAFLQYAIIYEPVVVRYCAFISVISEVVDSFLTYSQEIPSTQQKSSF